MLLDGLKNFVSGLGTARDKSTASHYALEFYSDAELQAAYRTSWLARKIVDLPADDATREWREWQAEASDISLIEAEEKRLKLKACVKRALILARLYGGAAIYIGTGETSPEKPLNPESIRKNGIKYLSVITRSRLSAGQPQLDPRIEGYGFPIDYSLNSIPIHPSRLVIFHGIEVPDPDMPSAIQGWGDSVLNTTLQAITAHDSVAKNIEALTYEAKVDVVKIKNFTENLRSGGATYENSMLSRWRLAMMGKGINGALMLDAEEEYEQKSVSFASLDALWDRFMQAVSGASDIPMTRLFGRSAAGMNATGEGDARNYYDSVKSTQTGDIEPAMGLLDECLIRSAMGDRPEDVHYNWGSLWQPSDKERAEVANTIVDALEKANNMAAFPPDVMTNALVNVFTETGVAPGLESDMADFFAEREKLEAEGLPPIDETLPPDEPTEPVTAEENP